MSRHNHKVPVSFYHRFTRDVCAWADRRAKGRVVSVLEGGYSDRALSSGALAHLAGLVNTEHHSFPGKVDESWWSVENLIKVRLLSRLRYCYFTYYNAMLT
jgi:histone deacetylase HOS3